MSDNSIKKIYYSMGEVCEIFDVKPSLIRFWEGKFTVLKPHKNKKGNRLFTVKDLENLKLIYHLVKEKGMTLQGAQVALKNKSTIIKADVNVVDKLQEIKALLEQLNQLLEDDTTVENVQIDEIPETEPTLKPTPAEEPEPAPLPFTQQSLF